MWFDWSIDKAAVDGVNITAADELVVVIEMVGVGVVIF